MLVHARSHAVVRAVFEEMDAFAAELGVVFKEVKDKGRKQSLQKSVFLG